MTSRIEFKCVGGYAIVFKFDLQTRNLHTNGINPKH
jgi:hypothetical protein